MLLFFIFGKITQKRRNTKEISAFFIAYSEKSTHLYYIICTFARITCKHNESIYIIAEAYQLFENREDSVIKVAIYNE